MFCAPIPGANEKSNSRTVSEFDSGGGASPFEEERIPPYTVMKGDALSSSNDPESARTVQCDARFILRKYRCLKRPDAVRLRLINETVEQPPSYSLPSSGRRNVHAHLCHAFVDFSRRDRAESGPSDNCSVVLRDESARSEVRSVPPVPVGHGGFECCLSCSDSFGVDRPNIRPVGRRHRKNLEHQLRPGFCRLSRWRG